MTREIALAAGLSRDKVHISVSAGSVVITTMLPDAAAAKLTRKVLCACASACLYLCMHVCTCVQPSGAAGCTARTQRTCVCHAPLTHNVSIERCMSCFACFACAAQTCLHLAVVCWVCIWLLCVGFAFGCCVLGLQIREKEMPTLGGLKVSGVQLVTTAPAQLPQKWG